MDSLCKREPEFGSLDSEVDMDDMGLLDCQPETRFSAAESCVDFRPRSSTWHGSNEATRFNAASVAPLSVHCPQSPFASTISETLEMLPNAESSSVRLSPYVYHSGGSAAAAGIGSSSASARSSLSPCTTDGTQHRQQHHQSQSQKRRNAWGNQSYSDLITQAIESSPQARLTLSEIYDWMIKNISYFSSKGDTNSSAGWKNSVRHNLSLHSKFVRVQNEQTGKSSYWTIDYGVRDRASYRRRAATADIAKSPELLKKRQAAVAAAAAANPGGRRRQLSDTAGPANTGTSSLSVESASPSVSMPPQELQVADVLHQLVPSDRLLDQNEPLDKLLIESLNDALLESFCGIGPGQEFSNEDAEAAVAAALNDPSLRSITAQLHQMTCRHELATCPLPNIQESDGAEAETGSAMDE